MANVQKNRKAGGAAHTGAARAKINLFLEVVGKRPDGYHDIDSVFAEIDLADTLTVWKRTDGVIRLEVFAGDPGGGHVDVSEIPVDGRNLVVRAAERLRERSGVGFGLGMRLEKRIPSGAGLGGGSSNAALALRLADACWGTNAREETLREIGAELGSDVPFFFSGGVCVCGGRGERVGPVPGVPSGVGVVVALTGTHSDTAAAYRNLRLPTLGEAFRSDAFLAAFLSKDHAGMERLSFNRFEETVFEALPELRRIGDELSALVKRPVRLSGSGGSLWFFAKECEGRQLVSREDLTAWSTANRVRLLPCEVAGCRV